MNHRQQGQSMVEMALTIPILLLILAGTLEVGWYFNVRINFQDASREGARIASDASLDTYHAIHNHHSPVYSDSNIDCGAENLDVYELAACMTLDNMQDTFDQNNGWDDIVVSLYQTINGQVTQILPADSGGSWSLTGAQRARITSEYISQHVSHPNWSCPLTIGYVAVEVFYTHKQLLGLFVINPYIPEYSKDYVYAVFPQNELSTSNACS